MHRITTGTNYTSLPLITLQVPLLSLLHYRYPLLPLLPLLSLLHHPTITTFIIITLQVPLLPLIALQVPRLPLLPLLPLLHYRYQLYTITTDCTTVIIFLITLDMLGNSWQFIAVMLFIPHIHRKVWEETIFYHYNIHSNNIHQ